MKKSLLVVFYLMASVGYCDHPIDVQRLQGAGEHYKALLEYEMLPKRRVTTESIISAAKSAWALGLNDKARNEFDKALQDETLSSTTRAKVYLSKGIIEFQDDNYDVSGLFAERSIKLLGKPSPLRSKALVLLAKNQLKRGKLVEAEGNLASALEEASEKEKGEIYYQLGECKLTLNKLTEAGDNYRKIPAGDERAPLAIRRLGEIAVETGKAKEAMFWLQKGQDDYTDEFIDSWVDFALTKSSISVGHSDGVRMYRKRANEKFPPSDAWLTLLNAEAETYEWMGESLKKEER